LKGLFEAISPLLVILLVDDESTTADGSGISNITTPVPVPKVTPQTSHVAKMTGLHTEKAPTSTSTLLSALMLRDASKLSRLTSSVTSS